MEILIYFAVIVGFYLIISFIAFVQNVLENLRLKKLLRNNKEVLGEIDFEKYNENIQIYQDFLSKNTLIQNKILPKPKLSNTNLTKSFFLSWLYKKYKYNNERLRDVLFK